MGNDIMCDTRQGPDGFVGRKSGEDHATTVNKCSKCSLGEQEHLMKAPAVLVTCHQTFANSEKPSRHRTIRTARGLRRRLQWVSFSCCQLHVRARFAAEEIQVQGFCS